MKIFKNKNLFYILTLSLFISSFTVQTLTTANSPKEERQISTASNSQIKIENILKIIKDRKVKFIQLTFVDILGNPKSCTINAKNASSALKDGISFDGSSITGYAQTAQSDLLLRPDLETFKILPLIKRSFKTALVVCDVCYYNGTSHPACTRSLLKRVETLASKMGYSFCTAPELEFFILKEDSSLSDEKGYCVSAEEDPCYEVKQKILKTLMKMGMEPEKFHHEVAQSQHEITSKYDRSLYNADNMILTKKIIGEIAGQHKLKASFIPKLMFGINGSGMHINYNLFDLTNNQNAFSDPKKPHFLSDLAHHFIAGNLKHVKEASAILNPTVNSYKRLVANFEAPVYICWGPKNRSALIRIPDSSPSSSRAEIRSPDAMCNPYLAFAVILASGLEGILNKEPSPRKMSENIFSLSAEDIKNHGIESLPSSLDEALKEMRQSSFIENLLGKQLFNKYLTIKEKEALEFNTFVTDWELKRYL